MIFRPRVRTYDHPDKFSIGVVVHDGEEAYVTLPLPFLDEIMTEAGYTVPEVQK